MSASRRASATSGRCGGGSPLCFAPNQPVFGVESLAGRVPVGWSRGLVGQGDGNVGIHITTLAGELILERLGLQLFNGSAPEGLREAVIKLVEARGVQVLRGAADGVVHFGVCIVAGWPYVGDFMGGPDDSG